MRYELINPDESIEATREYISQNQNWDVPNQRYRKPEAENIDPPLTECKIYKRGRYFIIEHNGIVHYDEHDGKYCYIEDALHYMNPDRPAKWKTLQKLITFRQAIRENNAQWMALDDLLKENITEKEFKDFINTARVFDKRHHGQETF